MGSWNAGIMEKTMTRPSFNASPCDKVSKQFSYQRLYYF